MVLITLDQGTEVLHVLGINNVGLVRQHNL